MSHRDELVKIVRRLGDGHLVGAEVGVYLGETSVRLLAEFPNLTLYMVDSWESSPANSAWRKTGDPCAKRTQFQQEAACQQARNVTEIFGDRRQIVRGVSWDVADQLPQLDFAFLDGDHSAYGVTNDLAAYWPKITKSGILCGHDYDSRGRILHIRGVKHAVDAFAVRESVQIEKLPFTVWSIRKN